MGRFVTMRLACSMPHVSCGDLRQHGDLTACLLRSVDAEPEFISSKP